MNAYNNQENVTVKGKLMFEVSEPKTDKRGKMFHYFKLAGKDGKDYFCLCYIPEVSALEKGEEIEVSGNLLPSRPGNYSSVTSVRVNKFTRLSISG